MECMKESCWVRNWWSWSAWKGHLQDAIQLCGLCGYCTLLCDVFLSRKFSLVVFNDCKNTIHCTSNRENWKKYRARPMKEGTKMRIKICNDRRHQKQSSKVEVGYQRGRKSCVLSMSTILIDDNRAEVHPYPQHSTVINSCSSVFHFNQSISFCPEAALSVQCVY